MEIPKMDPLTARFYESYVEQGAIHSEAPHSAMSKFFHIAFKPGDKVLDVGSGSGRDLAVLLKQGVNAYGIEPNDAMRAYALKTHPALAERVQPGLLPFAGLPFGGCFDGALCSAVLMHIHEDQLAVSLESILKLLKPNGKLLFSVPSMRPGLLKDGRDGDGRFFRNHCPDFVGAVLVSLGFDKIDLGGEAIARFPDISWTISLFERVARKSADTE